MVTSASGASELRHEKQQLLETMLLLTQEAASSPLPVEDVITLLDERTALMEQVASIDQRLAQLAAPPPTEAEEQRMRRCLEALLDHNQRVLPQLTGEKDALLNQLLTLRRPPGP